MYLFKKSLSIIVQCSERVQSIIKDFCSFFFGSFLIIVVKNLNVVKTSVLGNFLVKNPFKWKLKFSFKIITISFRVKKIVEWRYLFMKVYYCVAMSSFLEHDTLAICVKFCFKDVGRYSNNSYWWHYGHIQILG